jgi:hypothetical protein
MLTGDESLEELYARKQELESELVKLRGAEKREKESHLQDIESAIRQMKGERKPNSNDVLY